MVEQKEREREIEEEWYQRGKERGKNISSWIDLPEIGDRIDKFLDYIGIGDRIETVEDASEYFSVLCSEAESNGRDYSPFEFTASEINSLDIEGEEGDSEIAWNAFDEGISEAFEAEWEKRSKDFYTEEEN